MRLSDGSFTGTRSFSKVQIGGGGWITGMPPICDDSTVYARNDTNEPARLDPNATVWIGLRRFGINLPYGKEYSGNATYDIAACQSNSNVVWMVDRERLWYSSTRGSSLPADAQNGWEEVTAFPVRAGEVGGRGLTHEGKSRMVGPSMAVDPANGNVVVIGSQMGLFIVTRTGPGAFTCTKVTAIPPPANDVPGPFKRMLVTYDRSSPVVGGRTQGIHVWSEQQGSGSFWTTASGGASWTQDTACPATTAGCLRVHPTTGHVFIGGNGQGDLEGPFYRLVGSTWSSALRTAKTMDFHPTKAGWLVQAGAGSGLALSKDNGATFPWSRNPGRASTEAPWIAATNEAYMSNGEIRVNPVNAKLHLVFGLGHGVCDDPWAETGATAVFTIITRGVDQLIFQSVDIIHKPGHAMDGTVLSTCQDRVGTVRKRYDLDKPMREHIPDYTGQSIRHGSEMCALESDPNYIVLGHYPRDDAKSPLLISTTGGGNGTWNPTINLPLSGFDRDHPPGTVTRLAFGGNIICFSPGKFLYLSTSNLPPQFTVDNGQTWNWSAVGSRAPDPQSVIGGHHFYWVASRKLALDRRNPNIAYYVLSGNTDLPNTGDEAAHRGFFKTTDAGATLVKVSDLPGNATDFYWHGKIKGNKMREGHFMHCGGEGHIGFRLSVDACATWNDMALGFEIVQSFAFGAPRTPGDYETIYIAGVRSGRYGIFAIHQFDPLSLNGEVEHLARYPLGEQEVARDLAADLSVYARFVVNVGGSGQTMFNYVSTGRIVGAM